MREITIKETHRGIWYEDGRVVKVLEAGRYKIPSHTEFPLLRRPKVEITLVDVRERELTIKGQEILTSDKVAIRVSILVQFRVVDPRGLACGGRLFRKTLFRRSTGGSAFAGLDEFG